jgi:hypothetical protein
VLKLARQKAFGKGGNTFELTLSKGFGTNLLSRPERNPAKWEPVRRKIAR